MTSPRMGSVRRSPSALIALGLVVILGLAFAARKSSLTSRFHISQIKCHQRRPDLMKFEQCRMESKHNRTDIFVLSHVYDRPLKSMKVHLQCFQKRKVGYVPFLVNLEVDWCDFLRKRNIQLVDRVFAVMESSSNYNTKCPMDHEFMFLNMSLDADKGVSLPLQWMNGEYRVDIRLLANTKIELLANVFVRLI